ncbi:hypothetical protein P1X15_17675 [Runella sp. MFBS21]|uniref:hypothetical protein n=1 Tax=Runella sp. MFBS21 TaxID=3034018 RepID=UPI0023F97760|nr:hypothetical protein [Runella sp. MFBS21]MDF7819452.1 hypothetical protein [Runella sp. MFBS21]
MTAKNKKKWTLAAAIIMSLAVVSSIVTGLVQAFNFIRIIMILSFGASAGLYWYRYYTEEFEDD